MTQTNTFLENDDPCKPLILKSENHGNQTSPNSNPRIQITQEQSRQIKLSDELHLKTDTYMHRKMSHSVLNFLRRLYLIDQNDFKKLKFDSSNNPMDKTTVSTSSFDFIIEGDNESAVYTTSGERVVMKEILGEEDKMDVLNDSLQGLTGMLTQISEKVVEQGQVVDRIDFNTMTSLTLTKKANKVGFDAWGSAL